MQLGEVVGHATATIRHPTLVGWRLLVVQPLDIRNKADGEPQIVVDNLGCGRGDRVIMTSDGAAVRDLMGSKNTPVRWATIGLAD